MGSSGLSSDHMHRPPVATAAPTATNTAALAAAASTGRPQQGGAQVGSQVGSQRGGVTFSESESFDHSAETERHVHFRTAALAVGATLKMRHSAAEASRRELLLSREAPPPMPTERDRTHVVMHDPLQRSDGEAAFVPPVLSAAARAQTAPSAGFGSIATAGGIDDGSRPPSMVVRAHSAFGAFEHQAHISNNRLVKQASAVTTGNAIEVGAAPEAEVRSAASLSDAEYWRRQGSATLPAEVTLTDTAAVSIQRMARGSSSRRLVAEASNAKASKLLGVTDASVCSQQMEWSRQHATAQHERVISTKGLS